MLRITQQSNAAGAKSYFTRADYLVNQQELVGRWRGEGAKLLGLSGDVEHAQWNALCDGVDPSTGDKLLQRRKENRTVGYDFTFNAPKSVSLLYAFTQDVRVLEAFRDSVDATMKDIETEMQARVRKNGRNEDRITGNMIWGEFVHLTSRPVDGVADTHLHAHCFVQNLTRCDDEKVWKAGQFREIKRDAPYFEALFHARLAENLANLGLPIERKPKGWEIDGLSPVLLRKFSRRTTQIEAHAKELGIDDPKAKAALGAKTRSRKSKSLTFRELQAEWRSRLTSAESAAIAKLAARLGGDSQPSDAGAARHCVEYAIAHEFERGSVIPERRLLATALKRSVGAARPEDVVKAFLAADLIRATVKGQAVATTSEVLAEEREIVAFAKNGRGACSALAPSNYPISEKDLNEEQRNAVRHILDSRDLVFSVKGSAGVGKTTLVKHAVAAIEANGTKVIALAPSAAASRGVLRGEGFAQADTVSRLLVDEKMQENAKGQLLWVDEASLISARTMRDLFRLAGRIGARVLLTGDSMQHGSVNRGSVLRLLAEEAGIRPAGVKEIQRQKGQYKEAVKHLSDGRVAQGFKILDKLGWIRELPSDVRYQALAADYAAAVAQGKSALALAPTNWEADLVSSEIRRLLKDKGLIGKHEQEFTVLENAHLTQAEKSDPRQYADGDVLQFHQNAVGRRRGERIVVAGQPLPLEQAERFTVFRPSRLRIAPGDVIRITHNGMTADGKRPLDNGRVFTVKRFDRKGNIVVDNGWVIAKEFSHIARGFVSTSYGSQGRTVDRVFIGQDSAASLASNRQQFYVSASRAREQVTIYSGDKTALLEAVSQSADRLTASELCRAERQREVAKRFHRLNPVQEIEVRQPEREFIHER